MTLLCWKLPEARRKSICAIAISSIWEWRKWPSVRLFWWRISTGAVFAAIYGTLALLHKQERDRAKGVIINKFRGDVALLYSGIEQIESLTGVPVLGSDAMAGCGSEDEDGVALQTINTRGTPRDITGRYVTATYF